MINTPEKNILACIDAPDPDNFALIVALNKMYPNAQIEILLTGRPVNLNATNNTPIWDWDKQSSLIAQQASAARIKYFLKKSGITSKKIYDGGIAPKTLIPHHIHFRDYCEFNDIDPLSAIRHNELKPQEELAKKMITNKWDIVVGGPMTGLSELITRTPEITNNINEIHAMYGTWGETALMDFGGSPRGSLQFNVACDPMTGHNILKGLECPIYLLPSEVTRVQTIGFKNSEALRTFLPNTKSAEAICNLYDTWYEKAIKPRQAKNPLEFLFIHDVSAAFSLCKDLREAIYNIIPIEVVSVPHLPKDEKDWGKIFMKETDTKTNIFAAAQLAEDGEKKYLEALYNSFDY